eukprot:CAMPEP_0195511966 /NCGR_PEP_ID=MMETSP0794_2-20130614/4105_1 /TAXON_ID=515487 /ORGANISM="Stephanopyxis turris, Strain CCMP 815" /LENGTH=194 /DNA_ID=CAMNT_0040639671 /DNA_START=122 /DNA_END=706 /DNA_ORIENTATION=+
MTNVQQTDESHEEPTSRSTSLSSDQGGLRGPTVASSPSETTTSSSWTFSNLLNGIHQEIARYNYPACTRESVMWGIATGTAMGLHRWRMHSRFITISNFAFGTCLLVSMPSYFFCAKRMMHNENMVKELMQMNQFDPMSEAPEQPQVKQEDKNESDHPFLRKAREDEEDELGKDKEIIVYHQPERFPQGRKKGE